jgi:hypothetical protein
MPRKAKAKVRARVRVRVRAKRPVKMTARANPRTLRPRIKPGRRTWRNWRRRKVN